jgi:hypothetical protein
MKELDNGQEIEKLILMNNEAQLVNAFQILHDELMKYRRN